MPRRADVVFWMGTAQFAPTYTGGGVNQLIQTPAGVLYFVYVDVNNDVSFRKSTDGGLSWSLHTVVLNGTTTALSVWYDRWSGINAGLIHCAYTESINDDTLYRTIDTESSDALSTETVIFAGLTTATGGWLSITRSRGGNVYCYTCIDAGAEGGFFRLPNANVPSGAWDAARANPEALATTDQAILVPGFAADDQDIMCIFWDASANQISRYIYDDSGDSWAESIFTGTFTDVVATASFPHFSAAVDLTNSQIILLAWNAVDAANADLTCWTVTESAITAKTDVVTNSSDDQGLCGISLDLVTGVWTAFYCGKSDGTETWGVGVHLYSKGSWDGGTTWGPETKMGDILFSFDWMATVPRQYVGPPVCAYSEDQTPMRVLVNVDRTQPHAVALAGVM